MRYFLSVLRLLVILLPTVTVPLAASAAIPPQVTYQGYLTGTDGAPVNKAVTLQLSLYDTLTGGVPLWTEQQPVTVANAQFRVDLGAVTPLNLPFDRTYYLGIRVDNDQEMVPRQPFTSSPYALRSSVADAVADKAVGTGAIADAAVTAAKLGIDCSTGQVLIRADSGWACGSLAASSGTGAVTGVIAGAGLTGSMTAGVVSLDLNLAGTGSATSAARSDHDHDGVYRKKYGKVAVVAKTGGDYNSPSAALADLAAWCGVASAANPCLVRVMPGVYDGGKIPLAMVDFVDLEGAGASNTTISGGLDSLASGVVNGANSTLSRVSVTNSGGDNAQNAIAVFNAKATFNLVQVAVHAGAAANSYAIYNSDSGALRIGDSSLDAPGFSIFNGASATAATFSTAFTQGTVNGAGTLSCSGSRDGKNLFYAATCPPFQPLAVTATEPDPSGYYYISYTNPRVRARFNNDINPATLNTDTFTVTDAANGTRVAGTVQYEAATRTATFNLSAGAAGPQSYLLATITTGVRDMGGQKLATPYGWSFYVNSGTSDTRLPALSSVTPADKSTGVPSATAVSAYFDERLESLGNPAGLMTLMDGKGGAVPGKVLIAGQQVQFTPDAPLSLGTTYTATVSGVQDPAGNTQSVPYSWNFTTLPITAPTAVAATSTSTDVTVSWQPVPGGSGYNLYWSTSPFSGAAAGGAASSGPASGSPTPIKVGAVTSPYTFTPPTSLPFTGTLGIYGSGVALNGVGAAQFTLTVPAGITVTGMTSVYSGQVSFYQSDTRVTVAYSNSGGNGGNGSVAIAVQCSGEVAGKTMADFGFSAVTIMDLNGNPISGMHLTTDANGTAGTTYYFAVTAFNGVGESPYSSAVTALIDPFPPVVTGAGPTGDNIPVPQQINLGLSEQIDMQSVTSTTFKVTAGAIPVEGTFNRGSFYVGNANLLSGITFLPKTPLRPGTSYNVAVSGIKDLSGNALQAPYTWSFTTGVPAPASLTARGHGLQSSLSWTAVDGAAGYNIYWSTSYGVTPQNGTKIAGVTGTGYTHTGLVSGTTYYYVVTAVTGSIEGPPSYYASVSLDSVPPMVTSTNPANNATGVSVGNQIYVGFSESIDSSTWNSTNVTLKDNNGAVATGSYNGSSFTPNPALGFNTTYTMTIGPGIKDTNGNSLATPYSFSFTTMAVGTPSGLTATRGNLQSTLAWAAAAGATGYNIYWSTSYGVSPQNGTRISGVTGTSYTHTGLTDGTTYYYVVTALNGSAEGAPSYTASVLIDGAPPTVTSTTPANNAVGVPVGSSISVGFSKYLSTATWNNGNVTLTDKNGAVVSGSYSYQNFYPSQELAYNATYTMTIGTGVKDSYGNSLAAPYSFSFTTAAVGTPSGLTANKGNLQATLTWSAASAATGYNVYWSTSYGVTPQSGTRISGVTGTSYTHTGLSNGTTYYYVVTAVNGTAEGAPSSSASVLVDSAPPTVFSTSPGSNATGVAVGSMVSVNFNKNMNYSTWNSTNVTLKDGTGALVNGSYSGYYFYPNQAFGFNTTYTMTIGTGVQDNAGNSLAAPYSFSFTTTPVASPSILTASRGDLQSLLTWTAVAGATGYNVYWSTTAGVTPQNGIKISGITGTNYTHTGLANGNTYYYVVTAVNGTAEGLPSNGVSVLLDNVRPAVTTTAPADNAVGASVSAAVAVKFNKPISPSTWNSSNVSFRDGSGAEVSGSCSFAITSVSGPAPGQSASYTYSYSNGLFTPSAPLGYNKTYTMTIGTGLQDNAGNNPAAPYSFSFTTAVATPMSLTAAAGSAKADLAWAPVSGATSYAIYWSNAKGVTKYNSSRVSTGSASPSYSHTGLADGSTYVYRVAAVAGTNESGLSNEVTVSFDTAPPVVASKNVGQPGSSSVVVLFNEAIDPNSVTANTLQVANNGTDIAGNTRIGTNGEVEWMGFSNFNYGTTYCVTVSGVKDIAGNIMAPYSWTFTTSPLDPPSVAAAAGSTGTRKITLSWPVVNGATYYNVYWSSAPGVTVSNGTKVVGAATPFSHTGLEAGSSYYYVVTAASGQSESAAGVEVSAIAP